MRSFALHLDKFLFAFCASLALNLAGFTLAPTAKAAELAGVRFEDTYTHEGKPLTLNGLGLRKFAFFKVYVGGLYVEKKTSDAESLLASPDTKVLQLKFMRDVALKDIQKAWAQGYEKNCAKDQCALFQTEIQALNALMDECKETEILQFVFAPDAVQVWKNGYKKGEVKKAGLSAQVLAIFVGAQPPNEDLKKGLLGKL